MRNSRSYAMVAIAWFCGCGGSTTKHVTSDMSINDLGVSDLAVTDMTVASKDMAKPKDMTVVSNDMAEPKDMTVVSNDMAEVACAGNIVCDGFESGFNTALWSSHINVMGGTGTPTITVDSGEVYRGSHALHIHFPSTNSSADAWIVLATSKIPPTPHAFIRAHFFFESGFVGGGSNLFQAVQNNNNGYAIRTRMDPWDSVVADGMQPGIVFEEAANSASGSASQRPYTVPLNQWFCAELEIDQGSPATAAGVVATYFVTDGIPEPAETDVTDYSAGGAPYPVLSAAPTQTWIQEIDIGPSYTNSATAPVAGDIWIDDIAISTARIYCTD